MSAIIIICEVKLKQLHTYIHIYIRTYIYKHTYIHTYMYIYIHNTYIHTVTYKTISYLLLKIHRPRISELQQNEDSSSYSGTYNGMELL